jgi:hypothetical protein
MSTNSPQIRCFCLFLVASALGIACSGRVIIGTELLSEQLVCERVIAMYEAGIVSYNRRLGYEVNQPQTPESYKRQLRACLLNQKAPGLKPLSARLACAEAYGVSRCPEGNCEFRYPDACRGTQPEGVACAHSSQCESGMCSGTPEQLRRGCGTCTQRLKAGDACDPADRQRSCFPDLVCVKSDSTRGKGVCREPSFVALGELCATEDGFSVATCLGNATCGRATHRCGPVPKRGEACTTEFACGIGQACIDERCVTRAELGASCELNRCNPSLYCNKSTQRCAAYNVVGVNGVCANGINRCERGLVCVVQLESNSSRVSPGTCARPLEEGAQCPTLGFVQFEEGSDIYDGLPPCASSLQCISGRCAYLDPTTCR